MIFAAEHVGYTERDYCSAGVSRAEAVNGPERQSSRGLFIWVPRVCPLPGRDAVYPDAPFGVGLSTARFIPG